MPGITIRFNDGTYDLIAEEATSQEISITQFVREASLIRAWVLRMRRLDLDYEDEVAEIRAWLLAADGRRRNDYDSEPGSTWTVKPPDQENGLASGS